MIKKIFIILDLVLITAVVFFGVKLFYGVVTSEFDTAIVSAHLKDKHSVNRTIKKRSRGSSNTQHSFAAYKPIIKRDLFKTGRADKAGAEAINPSELENLQKTKLNLKLWGTITGNTGTTYAVIEDTSTRDQQLYREGDNIQHAGIKLVLRKKVVLTVNGQDEILEMEEVEDQGHRISSRPSTAPGNISAANEMVVERETINESLENINDLMRQIRVRPYFKDGKPSGLQLSGIRKGSVFEEMGLESGDVVKGVNGKRLQSVDDALNFYRSLKSAHDVELEIERGGASQVINYRID